jgi:hypothetical protein
VTARRLNQAGNGPSPVNEGPGAPQVVCRLWSSDEGRSWTQPDQLMPGAWPSLAVAGQHTLCANTHWAAWNEMRLVVSRDGFATFHQQVPMKKGGWTRGMTYRPQETPLPPTVPYLADEWPFEHYGYPSVLPLDQERLIVVFGEPQRGTVYVDGFDSETLDIPWEKERIRAVFFRRTTVEGDLVPRLAGRPRRPDGRWVLAERIVVEDFGAVAQDSDGNLIGVVKGQIRRSSDGGRNWQPIKGSQLPSDKSPSALAVLKSGRWLAATNQWNRQETSTYRSIQMGLSGGYPTFKATGGFRDTAVVVWRSDDQGKTWKATEPFKGPFKWALPSVGHFIEGSDGLVALPIHGCVTNEEMVSGSCSNGVIRSRDGGVTWDDFSFVFRTNPKGPDDFQAEPSYTEMDIVQLSNGHWVAYSRSETIVLGPKGWGTTDVALSTDLGRTWRKTGASLVSAHQQKGILLPDGGIALTYRCHSWQAPGVAISYDEGRSFDYLLAGPYETINAFRHGNDEFLVFTAKSHRSDMSAGVYRWVPNRD